MHPRTPVLVAEYLNGNRHWQSIDKYSREDVGAWLDVVRTASGKEFQTQNKGPFTYDDVCEMFGYLGLLCPHLGTDLPFNLQNEHNLSYLVCFLSNPLPPLQP